jgi:hypothetical protein
VFPSAADLNHLRSTFFAFFEGGGRVLCKKGFVFFGGKKLRKEKKKKEGKKAHTLHTHIIYFPTLLECAGGRFLSLLLLLSTAATPRENKNKHNDDNNGRSTPRLGEISIHPVRSFPPLPPPLFKLSRKKSSSWTKNLQCIFVVPSPKMQS